MTRHYSEDPQYTEISTADKLLRDKIIAVIDRHTKEMEGYSYFGSNPGVSTDDYDDIADDILKEFGVSEKLPKPDVEIKDGWVIESPDYGTWFVSRQVVTDDYISDHIMYYGKKPDSVSDVDVDSWFDEQIWWPYIVRLGIQIYRPPQPDYRMVADDDDRKDNVKKV